MSGTPELDPYFRASLRKIFGERADDLSPPALKQLFQIWIAGRESVQKKEETPADMIRNVKSRLAELKCAYCFGRGTVPAGKCLECKGTGHMA